MPNYQIGEAIVKLRIAEAMQGKRIMLLPMSEGGMNLKTTDMNKMSKRWGSSRSQKDNDGREVPSDPYLILPNSRTKER